MTHREQNKELITGNIALRLTPLFEAHTSKVEIFQIPGVSVHQEERTDTLQMKDSKHKILFLPWV